MVFNQIFDTRTHGTALYNPCNPWMRMLHCFLSPNDPQTVILVLLEICQRIDNFWSQMSKLGDIKVRRYKEKGHEKTENKSWCDSFSPISLSLSFNVLTFNNIGCLMTNCWFRNPCAFQRKLINWPLYLSKRRLPNAPENTKPYVNKSWKPMGSPTPVCIFGERKKYVQKRDLSPLLCIWANKLNSYMGKNLVSDGHFCT